MKKIFVYILIFSWLFAFIDWKVIHVTRWTRPEYKDAMHNAERTYALVTRTAETILCAPCMALKPVFLETMKRVEASQEEQDAITHAPAMNAQGFYQLPERGMSWTFVPWGLWLIYWSAPSVLWFVVIKRFL